jgi:uncharacterized protein YuzE
MNLEYDRSVDAASLYLREVEQGEVRRTETVVLAGRSGPQEITFGFTEMGELVSIEFLDAAHILPVHLLQ